MVNSVLLNEIKLKLSDGSAMPGDCLKLFEIYKQISSENAGLREEFDDMAMLDMDFLGQIIISDENKKFWFKFKEGKIDYGEGDVGNPSLAFTTNMDTFTGILFGTIEISGAHEAGDVSFDGGSEALMDLQAITSVLNDFLQNI
ncbi:MAG TPA: SCP2 sterol-binding domain-containing protein [Candidatus Nanopelagicaceae bacterium]|nr:SCP2 sterol-binding domain-containing protein [Candidatus Nanopelagicaceae bacterium]